MIGKLPTTGRTTPTARATATPGDWAAVQESRGAETRLPGGTAFAREANSRQAAQAYQTQASAVRGAFRLNETHGEARATGERRENRSVESRELAKGIGAYADSERVVSSSSFSRPHAGARLDVML